MVKKICIINFNIYCLFNPRSSAPMGGAELDMYTLALSLKENFSVSVITGDWGQKPIEVIDGVTVFRAFSLKKTILNYIKAPFIFWNSLKKVDADVYVSSGAGLEVGMIALFCKLKKKRFIYRTASSMDCDGSYVLAHKFFGRAYEYGLKQSDRIVTSVRQHSALLSKRYPKLAEKLNHINLGIPPGGRMVKKEYILWVSRCDPLKKPEIFLDIAKTLSRFSFVMICPKQNHNPNYFDKIKKRVASLPNMTFIDFVPFKDIQPYFDGAKIFVNTSDFEGFTYTLIQSGLARTPVVYLNVNPDEVITKHDLGYYADGDFDRMVRQVQKLLSDEKDWKEKSENAFRYIKENHDIRIVGEQWKELLQILLKK